MDAMYKLLDSFHWTLYYCWYPSQAYICLANLSQPVSVTCGSATDSTHLARSHSESPHSSLCGSAFRLALQRLSSSRYGHQNYRELHLTYFKRQAQSMLVKLFDGMKIYTMVRLTRLP